MVIGFLEIELSMPGNRSLKEKRMVLRSVKDRIRNRFNVSIAEVARQDKWCAARLAAAVVSVDSTHAHKVLESVVKHMERNSRMVLLDYRIEMI